MSAAGKRLAASPLQQPNNVLIIDIERLPGLARVWDQKTRFIPVSQWTKMPSLLCFAAKWYGDSDRNIMFHSAWDDGPEAMTAAAHRLYDQATTVVTYNGVAFDNRHLRGEWLKAGYPPPRPWKDVDLYKVNAQSFGFESRSLSHLCNMLGLENKAGHYDAVLAERAMDGDAKAQAAMRRYNIQDVRITTQCYDRLRGYIPGHPHNPAGDGDALSCNQCWGTRLEDAGVRLAASLTYRLYKCLDCGANIQGPRQGRAAMTSGAR